MSEATEMLEHMEHAGHGGGHGEHGKGPGRIIGITMAVLGVMLALCAALVGSQRTDLIKTMVEQSNKWGVYQSESMKFRVMEADAEILHALTPSKTEVAKFEDALKGVRSRSGKADDEDTAEVKDTIDVATRELADILSPDKEDEDHFGKLRNAYRRDMAEAKEDAEAYDLAIEAHEQAAEWYERAQLCAEIGIVIASIALFLANRKAWTVSIVMGVAGAIIIVMTFARTNTALAAAEKKIEDASKNAVVIDEDDKDGDGQALTRAKPGTPESPVGRSPPPRPRVHRPLRRGSRSRMNHPPAQAREKVMAAVRAAPKAGASTTSSRGAGGPVGLVFRPRARLFSGVRKRWEPASGGQGTRALTWSSERIGPKHPYG